MTLVDPDGETVDVFGEYPPIDALPRDALRKKHVNVLGQLVNVRLIELDQERREATSEVYKTTLLSEIRELESIQHILAVLA